jgi:hypothetical protein
MGNNQSQTTSPNPNQKPLHRKFGKLAGIPALGRAKDDSGYRSGSASSSGTAVKASDQTGTAVVSAGSDQGSIPRPEAAPAAVEKRGDTPAPATETVCRNYAIYRSSNR